ncbi:hypothetical protein SUDANB70_00466 [Streptomyces sp. enrichment culture]
MERTSASTPSAGAVSVTGTESMTRAGMAAWAVPAPALMITEATTIARPGTSAAFPAPSPAPMTDARRQRGAGAVPGGDGGESHHDQAARG